MTYGDHKPVTTPEVEKYIRDIDYPIGKEDLILNARAHDAPPEVLAVLEHIPDRRYNNAVDVAKGIGRSDVNERG